jgi:cytochrome bd ubiquinol oxidase subunit II
MIEPWLPLIMMMTMALAMLAYVVLDGYDLGIGILLLGTDDAGKDQMIASIGPFWDANETWLVFAVGILLIAFPIAHGVILTSLYLPVVLMLIGLILRGVAFDFRVKGRDERKRLWNFAFFAGSLLAAMSQGYMLGSYILGFESSLPAVLFACFIGVCLASGYALLGATWTMMKCDDALQAKAIGWARIALWLTGAGIVAVSIATPLVSPRMWERWFDLPATLYIAPIPLASVVLFLICDRLLARRDLSGGGWKPFGCAVGIFVLAFFGLAYSLYPYLVVDRITFWEAASAPASLWVIFIGVAITLPAIIGYTVFAYRVFWGKTGQLSYD